MNRISTQAANTVLLGRIFKTQQTVFQREIQTTSEKKSQDYQGIARDSRRLVNVETTRTQLQRYVSNNEQVDVRLQITENVVESFRTTVVEFRRQLRTYAAGEKTDKERVDFIQTRAHESLKNIQSLLNTDIDGRYLFSGSRTDTEPVDLGLSTIEAFQSKYDGARIKYPETGGAHLESFSISSDTNNLNTPFVTAANFLQFRQDSDGDAATGGTSTIEASSAMFSNVAAGAYVTVANTANNNGVYTVDNVSPDGRTITVRTEMLTDEAASPAVGIAYPDPDNPLNTLTLSSVDFGQVAFSRNDDTITATTANGLANVPVGSTFTVSGSVRNNGVYTVSANTGTAITIESKKLTDEAANTALGGSTFFSYQSDTHIEFERDAATSTNTITVNQNDDTTAVPSVFNGLVVGNQITVAGTTSNNGTFTITDISPDGSRVTVDEPVVNETDNDGMTFAGAHSVAFAYTSKTQMRFTRNAAAPDTIQIRNAAGAGVPNAFSSLSAGQTFAVSGTAAHDGSYTIRSISPDGSQITINEDLPAATATDNDGALIQVFGASGTVSASSYYSGDRRSLNHRVDDDRTIELDVLAAHPALEKAIRGISLILQGKYGSKGGLDQNQDRAGQAEYLLESALERTVAGTPPFGAESVGSLEQMQIDLGFNRVLIDDTNKLHTDLIGFFEKRIIDLENVNLTETLAYLLDEQRALEASFQVFSRVRKLSLTNFL